MAYLGELTIKGPSARPRLDPVPVTDYNINRGFFLGELNVKGPRAERGEKRPADGYIVRQIRILYRQLWPAYGQRFPQ